MNKNFWHNIIFNSYISRIVFALILCFFVSLIFFMSLSLEKNTDPAPKIEFLTKKAIKEFGIFSSQVQVGMYIKDFLVFDIKKSFIKINAAVWFKYDPSQVDGDLLDKFSFLNGVVKSKSFSDKKIWDGMVFVQYDVVVEIDLDLNFDYYPYSSHRLPLILVNDYLTTSEVFFVANDDGFNLTSGLIVSGWQIDSFNVDYGYRRAVFDKIDARKTLTSPIICFDIFISPQGSKDIFILMVPMLVMILLSLLFLLIPFNKNSYKFDLSISTLPLTMFVAFRFVIGSMIPDVGYSTIVDKIFTGILFLIFIVFMINIFSLIFISRDEAKVLANHSRLIYLQNIFYIISFFIISFSLLIFLSAVLFF